VEGNAVKRRDVVKAALASGLGLATIARAGRAAAVPAVAQRPGPFRLKYAPHLGMFRHSAGEDAVAQLDYMADQGFRAFEDNEMRGRPVAEQERIAAALRRHGMTMGVFVAHTIGWREPNLTSGDAAARDRFVAEVRESVDVARRVNARWMTVVPGLVHPRLDMLYQTANVVDSLRRAADVLEPHGLVIVIEPLNTRRDHPGQFLTHIAQAYAICKAVRSPAVKILYDAYHQQITEGNLIPNLDLAWDEIGYIQVGDNPGRKEPGSGEINYRNVFRHLHGKGWDGVIGMEHGNSQPGREGEAAVIRAYREADAF
jgi:hydroxypyruvate isomerase